jgi:sugar porter (SP) family MFS transporter
MNSKKILYWSITVALAGFLFGFDTVVISGAEQTLKTLWNRGDAFHGFVIVGSALWGTVFGAIFGGIPTDKLGRRSTLFIIGILYTVSAVGSALATDPWVFAAFRFIGGLGVGASTIAAPAYITEISSAENRGRLVAMYQFNIVFGILIAFLSNYLISEYIPSDAWRWMIGIEAVPAVIYTLMVFTVPKSPRWLLTQNRRSEAEKYLKIISPDTEFDVIIDNIEEEQAQANYFENIFMKKYRFPLTLAFLLAFFNQFSGINALLYYSKNIFQAGGLDESSALLSSVGIGVVNLVFTILGLLLIDRLGRRQLMYIGSVGYIVSLAMTAIAFYLGWSGFIIPLFLFVFIAAHAIGQGAVIWVFISEIFPTHLRANGQAFGSGTHWVLAAIIPSMVPILFSTIGESAVFGIFAVMMVFQLIFVWKMMPETKGKTLEELNIELTER